MAFSAIRCRLICDFTFVEDIQCAAYLAANYCPVLSEISREPKKVNNNVQGSVTQLIISSLGASCLVYQSKGDRIVPIVHRVEEFISSRSLLHFQELILISNESPCLDIHHYMITSSHCRPAREIWGYLLLAN